ncbi:MAG: MFS transporter [Pirellulaceae bacterium]|nr:MFS transporter [Pirellulaceae bacterium]
MNHQPPHQSLDDQRRLPRSLWVVSWISFLADISGEMIFPLLPLYMVVVLGASHTQLGLMEGAAVLLVAWMSIWSGARSDVRKHRAVWMRWGYGLPVLGKLLIAVAVTWPVAVGGRWLDRFGKGLRSAPRDALIADLVDAAQRGRAFGLHRAFDTAGALLGVLLSAVLLWWLAGSPATNVAATDSNPAQHIQPWVFRMIIGVGAVLGLGSLLLTWWIEDPQPELDPKPANDSNDRHGAATFQTCEARPLVAEQSLFGLPKQYWIVLGCLALFGLANSSDAFLLLRASQLGMSPWQVVMAYATFNVSYTIVSYPAGVWSDGAGRWRVIGLGWSIYVVAYAGMALLNDTQVQYVWPLMALYGVYMALTEGVGKALIADQAPVLARGRALGIFQATLGTCGLLASLLVGLIWDTWSSSAALGTSALLACLALLMVLVACLVARRQR